MEFVLKIMNFALKIMDFVLKMLRLLGGFADVYGVHDAH